MTLIKKELRPLFPFISSQVDEVAKSMLETERTMNELQFVTGLENLDEQVPDLVQQQVRALK